MCLCMYVCMYVCVYVCMYVLYVCMYVHVYPSHFNYSVGSLAVRAYRHDVHMVTLKLHKCCVSGP